MLHTSPAADCSPETHPPASTAAVSLAVHECCMAEQQMTGHEARCMLSGCSEYHPAVARTNKSCRSVVHIHMGGHGLHVINADGKGGVFADQNLLTQGAL